MALSPIVPRVWRVTKTHPFARPQTHACILTHTHTKKLWHKFIYNTYTQSAQLKRIEDRYVAQLFKKKNQSDWERKRYNLRRQPKHLLGCSIARCADIRFRRTGVRRCCMPQKCIVFSLMMLLVWAYLCVPKLMTSRCWVCECVCVCGLDLRSC